LYWCLLYKPPPKHMLRFWYPLSTLPKTFFFCHPNPIHPLSTKHALTKLKHKTYCRAHTSLPNFFQKSLDKKIRFHCLPWTSIKFTGLPKKSTSPITHRDRFQSLIINHPNTNICYTDGVHTQITGLALPTLLTINYARNVIVTPRQFSQQNARQSTSRSNVSSPTDPSWFNKLLSFQAP